MTTPTGQPVVKPQERLATRLRRLEEKLSRVLTGVQAGTFAATSDPDAVHVGDAAGVDVGGTFPDNLTVPGLTGKQALNSNLTAIAALTTQTFGRSVLETVDAAALRTLAGLVIGTNVQAYDADLSALAALTTQAFGRSVLETASASALRTLAGLVIGTDVAAQGDSRFPTANEKAAMAGTDGSPSNTNRFVTDSDPLRYPTQLALPDAILSLDPALYYKLGASGGLTDQGSGGHNGTAGGGVTVGGGASLTSDGGGSTDFDGTNDYVDTGYSPFVAGSTRTFMGWTNRDASGTNDALFNGTAGTTYPALRTITSDNTVQFVANNATGGGGVSLWNMSPFLSGSVYHWALIFNETANTAELFLNGISQGIKTLTDNYNSPGTLQIGAIDSFDGKMAHFVVFERALTPPSIEWLYRIGAGHTKDFGFVSTLPTGVLRGDTCQYLADSTNGIIWPLVYDGQGTYPWKTVGQPAPLHATSSTSRALTNQTTYASLPTDPLSLVLPLAGDYDVFAEAEIAPTGTPGAGATASLSYSVGGTAASDSWRGVYSIHAAGVGPAMSVKSQTTRHTGLSASTTLTEKGKTGGNYTINWTNRRLRARPVRVG